MNRARIEALWAKRPSLTIEQVRRATGAPDSAVRRVYAQLLATGRLLRPKHAARDFLRVAA